MPFIYKEAYVLHYSLDVILLNRQHVMCRRFFRFIRCRFFRFIYAVFSIIFCIFAKTLERTDLPRQHKEGPFTYIEPFIGGGAMLFHVLREHDNIKRAVINEALNDVERTSFLLFLNRTCFNGLYRENSKGKFNVPFGYYKHPTICNRETILADSEILNRKEVVILNGDFEGVRKYMDSEGVNIVYFDPPYRPLNATSSFNSYVKQGFGDEEQARLRNFAADIATSGNVYWMISNSDCSAKNPEDLFFETLYKDFHINRVYASRAINANPSKRGKLTELLICNYGPENFSEDNQMEQSLF